MLKTCLVQEAASYGTSPAASMIELQAQFFATPLQMIHLRTSMANIRAPVFFFFLAAFLAGHPCASGNILPGACRDIFVSALKFVLQSDIRQAVVLQANALGSLEANMQSVSLRFPLVTFNPQAARALGLGLVWGCRLNAHCIGV